MLQFEKIKWPFRVIGLMSGTSMDGVDLAACTFTLKDDKWSYAIDAATTLPYPAEWKSKLPELHLSSGQELAEAHAKLGRYFGECIREFSVANSFKPDLVGSHGHTVFHQPDKNFTLQIGDGAAIAAISGIDTVCDFRSKDLALGGQGAPLVPVGDQHLFGEFAACLNLGGIANVSFDVKGSRKAWDICPVNMILNHLAAFEGAEYDEGGKLAREGNLLPELLDQLNELPFYLEKGPRSLGREWFEKVFLPVIKQADGTNKDKLHTATEHIAVQITSTLNSLKSKGPVLVTGGGAFNSFLIDRMNELSDHPLTIPSGLLINFKEALVFAFLAALFAASQENILSSATGSTRNSTGGALYRAS